MEKKHISLSGVTNGFDALVLKLRIPTHAYINTCILNTNLIKHLPRNFATQ